MHSATKRLVLSKSDQLSQQELRTHKIKAKEQSWWTQIMSVHVLFIRDLQKREKRRALL